MLGVEFQQGWFASKTKIALDWLLTSPQRD